MANSPSPEWTDPKPSFYHKLYTPTLLNFVYDFVVLRFNMNFMWGVSTNRILLPFFTDYMSHNHMDVGVATGWFPSRALSTPWRRDAPQSLTLVDLSPNSLEAARARVLDATTATKVRSVEADATAPAPKALRDAPVDSLSMFNLFHCVPGGAAKFPAAFAAYKDVLADAGVLYGCTVLGDRYARGLVSRWYVRHYNKRGIFHNLDDTEDDVRRGLEENFEEVQVWVVGMACLFRAHKPKRGALVDVA